MKKRFSEEQIIRAMKAHEAGEKAADIIRELGISEQTFYRWKSKYGGMEVAEARRLKQLEEENRRLKEIVANLTLDNQILKEVLQKKSIKPAKKRELAEEISQAYGISERRACRILDLNRSSKRYKATEKSVDEKVIERMKELIGRWLKFGYRRIHILLKKEGLVQNRKRTYRLYSLAELKRRRKNRIKRYEKRGKPEEAGYINERWSMDFVQDRLASGQKIRILTVIDEISRESPLIAVDTCMTGRRVCAALNQAAWFRELPKEIKTDNGTEFTGNALQIWCEEHKVKHIFTDPGSPTQNGHIESFNGKLRDECLNAHCFRNLSEARAIIEEWRISYNTERPHTSLNGMTPEEYRLSVDSQNAAGV